MRIGCSLALVVALLAGCPAGGDDDDTTPQDDDDSASTTDDDDDDTTAADDDDDTVETVQQEPVTFTVTNATADNLYLPYYEWWTEGLNDLLACAVASGDAWAGCLYGLPYGVTECTDDNLDDYCPGEPDGGSAVLVLEPGSVSEVVWPGTLWAINTSHCASGVCADEGDPTPGTYAASMIAWSEMGCFHGDCPDDKKGVMWEAYVTGDTTACETGFEVPYTGDALELVFQ